MMPMHLTNLVLLRLVQGKGKILNMHQFPMENKNVVTQTYGNWEGDVYIYLNDFLTRSEF